MRASRYAPPAPFMAGKIAAGARTLIGMPPVSIDVPMIMRAVPEWFASFAMRAKASETLARSSIESRSVVPFAPNKRLRPSSERPLYFVRKMAGLNSLALLRPRRDTASPATAPQSRLPIVFRAAVSALMSADDVLPARRTIASITDSPAVLSGERPMILRSSARRVAVSRANFSAVSNSFSRSSPPNCLTVWRRSFVRAP